MQLVTPNGNEDITIDNMENLEGQCVETAPGSGHFVKIRLPQHTTEQSLLARYL